MNSRAGFDVVEMLRDLVRIPSVNPHGDPGTDAVNTGERRVAEWVGERLEALGATVELRDVLPGRPNVLARFPTDRPGKGAVLFAPHTDTVSVAGMTVEPFGGEVREGRLWGRGATDTKGTLAAMLAAFAGLGDDLPRLNREIWFAGLMGEEAGNEGAHALAVDPEWRTAAFAVVGEPTGCDIVRAHKGALWLRLRTVGRAVHGAHPERGDNAVYKMADVLRAVRDDLMPAFAREPDPLLGPATANVGTVHGGSKINIVPDRCEAELDIRTIPAQGRAGFVDEVVAWLTKSCPDLQFDLIRRHHPLDTDAGHWGVRALETAGGAVRRRPMVLRREHPCGGGGDSQRRRRPGLHRAGAHGGRVRGIGRDAAGGGVLRAVFAESMNSVAGDIDALDPRQIAFWRKLTPGQRLDRAMALMRQVRRFQASCVRAQHPDWDDGQVAAELRRRWLFSHHADLARRAA